MKFPRLVDTHICTWEITTGFESNLTDEELILLFSKDFPHIKKMPQFLKMISFNTQEGRKHRYLVIFFEEEIKKGEYVFFRPMYLYSLADWNIRNCDCNGCYRYVSLMDNTLYILVFFEGRLCHFSEEAGYSKENLHLVKERVNRFDHFLKEDFLFSQEKISKNELDIIDVDFKNLSAFEKERLLKILKEPFWKSFFSDSVAIYKKIILITILVFCVFSFLLYQLKLPYEEPLTHFESVSAVELSEPIIEASLEKREFPLPGKKFDTLEKNTCGPSPLLEIKGIVAHQIFTGFLNHSEKVMIKEGDSIENFMVSSILRDRVILVCQNEKREIINGKL